MSRQQQDKGKKQPKQVAVPKRNPLQAIRTAANKNRRAQLDIARKQNGWVKKQGMTPRGSARAARRERWASVRQPAEVVTVRDVFDPIESKKQGKIILKAITEKKKSWKPTFAEWSAQEVRRG